MPDNQPPPAPGGFLRGMAMAIGVLIMTASGLCSAGFLVNMTVDLLEDGSTHPLADFGTVLGMIAVWGGVPFLVGWAVWRSSRGKRDDGA